MRSVCLIVWGEGLERFGQGNAEGIVFQFPLQFLDEFKEMTSEVLAQPPSRSLSFLKEQDLKLFAWVYNGHSVHCAE